VKVARDVGGRGAAHLRDAIPCIGLVGDTVDDARARGHEDEFRALGHEWYAGLEEGEGSEGLTRSQRTRYIARATREVDDDGRRDEQGFATGRVDGRTGGQEDGRGWERMGEDGRGWERMGEDGRGWERMGEDGRGWERMEEDGRER
jgi:hypothetical protein